MRKFVAEALGCGVLTFMGCASAVLLLGVPTPAGVFAVAATFGLSIIALAYVIGDISGCHINPAVSIAMFLTKRIDQKTFMGYVVAQVIGAIIGAGLLYGVLELNNIPIGLFGTNGFADDAMYGAIVVEIILTFIFVFTILGVTADPKKGSVAGIVIGATLMFVHLVGMFITGTSVNPARSIGPALFHGIAVDGSQALGELWVFIVAPLIGGAVAAIVYSYVFHPVTEGSSEGDKSAGIEPA